MFLLCLLTTSLLPLPLGKPKKGLSTQIFLHRTDPPPLCGDFSEYGTKFAY
jgi:hypothetical protein